VQFLFGRPALSLDLTDPPGDDGRVGSGLECLAVAGKPSVTAREGPPGGLRAAVFCRSRFLGLGERATRLLKPIRLEDPADPVIERRDDLGLGLKGRASTGQTQYGTRACTRPVRSSKQGVVFRSYQPSSTSGFSSSSDSWISGEYVCPGRSSLYPLAGLHP
jgi:hypothetical protein